METIERNKMTLDDSDEFYNPFAILESLMFEPADERTKQLIIDKYTAVGEEVTSVNFYNDGLAVNFTGGRRLRITTEYFGD